jgi:hypothetical protein
MTQEGEIAKAILKDLRAMGVFCFKHWGGPMRAKGVPDILGVLPGGRFLALEAKARKGKLTPAQASFLQSVAVNGDLAFMARSVEAARERLAEEGVFHPQRRLFQTVGCCSLITEYPPGSRG